MSTTATTIVDRKPTPIANVESEIVEGEVLLYHPQQTKALYLNPAAAVVWGLCDGQRSVGEIISLLEDAYPDAKAMMADDVRQAVETLREGGVIVLR